VNRQVIEGGEFDWFAVDCEGHIGHFATAGFGPVPSAVLARLDELRKLDERVLSLPAIGEATGHLSCVIDDWLDMARRGLFAYDWQHWSGPYLRAATPSAPILIDQLPTGLRESVRLVEWPGVRFTESPSVRPEELCPCE
jgi:hypothetical protein